MVAWGPIYISNSIIICIGCTNKQYCIMIIWNNKTNNIIQTLFIYKYDIHIYQKDNKIVMGILYGIYPSKVRITCVFIYIFWVGGDWNHGILWLSIQLGMSSSQLTFTPSFFRRDFGQPPSSISATIFGDINWDIFGDFTGNKNRIPLVIQHSHGKWPIYRWFTYWKWWFSMAMLNDQMVTMKMKDWIAMESNAGKW